MHMTYNVMLSPHRLPGPPRSAFAQSLAPSTRTRQHLIDLSEQLPSPVRLGYEAAFIWNLGPTRLFLTGGHHEQNMRPTFVNQPCEFDAIDAAGHLYVGEQQPHIRPPFQRSQRVFSVCSFNNGVTVVLQEVGRVQAQQLFVFDDEDGGFGMDVTLGHIRQRRSCLKVSMPAQWHPKGEEGFPTGRFWLWRFRQPSVLKPRIRSFALASRRSNDGVGRDPGLPASLRQSDDGPRIRRGGKRPCN